MARNRVARLLGCRPSQRTKEHPVVPGGPMSGGPMSGGPMSGGPMSGGPVPVAGD